MNMKIHIFLFWLSLWGPACPSGLLGLAALMMRRRQA